MNWIKRFLLLALLVLVVMQFVQPVKNEGGYQSLEVFLNETKPTPAVAATLKTACYDCHSNQTDYPWYNTVAPVSYWIANHIEEGKHHLNFSEEVKDGKMPLDEYTWTHADANLNEQQINELLQWAQVARLQYGPQLKVQ